MSEDYRKANGTPTTKEDPERLMWYSARCTYWTDDWSQLSTPSRIPCCPNCGSVGYQGEMGPWLDSAEDYAKAEGNSGYFQFLLSIKEVCKGISMLQAWEAKRKGPRQG